MPPSGRSMMRATSPDKLNGKRVNTAGCLLKVRSWQASDYEFMLRVEKQMPLRILLTRAAGLPFSAGWAPLRI
eukprot:303709-Amphidinium_carterae.2